LAAWCGFPKARDTNQVCAIKQREHAGIQELLPMSQKFALQESQLAAPASTRSDCHLHLRTQGMSEMTKYKSGVMRLTNFISFPRRKFYSKLILFEKV
jgi:hypothetical protein